MTTRQRVPYDDLRGYLKLLEENGLLKRISAEVDLEGELGAIAYRSLVRDGPGLLFENIKDYPDMPLVANIMYTEEQLALALNGDPDWASLRDIIHEGMQDRTATNVVPSGPVKDVKIMGEDVDLDMLPTPRWHEEDGGRYIGTTAGFVTRDPQTGNLNMGQYRSMIIDKNTTTVEIMGDWEVGATPPGASNYGGAGDRNGATTCWRTRRTASRRRAPSCWAWTRCLRSPAAPPCPTTRTATASTRLQARGPGARSIS